MSGPAPIGNTPPNFRTPRLVGIFNVLFATQILVCGLCMSGYALTLPLWARVFTQAQRQVDQQLETAKKAELDAIAEQEAKATTEKQKAVLAERRREAESRPKTVMMGSMDISKFGMTDPEFLAWTWTELLTGLALNLAMLISGIGLLHWRPWARSVAFWTAGLKIVRLVLVYGFFIIAIAPPMGRKMGEMVVEMMAAQQAVLRTPGNMPPADFFARVYAITYSIYGAALIVFGVIYPAILLWILSRPGVKAACAGRLKLPKEPKQPW